MNLRRNSVSLVHKRKIRIVFEKDFPPSPKSNQYYHPNDILFFSKLGRFVTYDRTYICIHDETPLKVFGTDEFEEFDGRVIREGMHLNINCLVKFRECIIGCDSSGMFFAINARKLSIERIIQYRSSGDRHYSHELILLPNGNLACTYSYIEDGTLDTKASELLIFKLPAFKFIKKISFSHNKIDTSIKRKSGILSGITNYFSRKLNDVARQFYATADVRLFINTSKCKLSKKYSSCLYIPMNGRNETDNYYTHTLQIDLVDYETDKVRLSIKDTIKERELRYGMKIFLENFLNSKGDEIIATLFDSEFGNYNSGKRRKIHFFNTTTSIETTIMPFSDERGNKFIPLGLFSIRNTDLLCLPTRRFYSQREEEKEEVSRLVFFDEKDDDAYSCLKYNVEFKRDDSSRSGLYFVKPIRRCSNGVDHILAIMDLLEKKENCLFSTIRLKNIGYICDIDEESRIMYLMDKMKQNGDGDDEYDLFVMSVICTNSRLIVFKSVFV